MRGSTYAFVNSTRLQQRLRTMGVHYLHMKELAPSQSIQDAKSTTKCKEFEKRSRAVLGEAFVEAYKADDADICDLTRQNSLPS